MSTIDTANAIDMTPGIEVSTGGTIPSTGVEILDNILYRILSPGTGGSKEGVSDIIGETEAIINTSWEGYFGRGIIIILGFIFVAVGLSMFRA